MRRWDGLVDRYATELQTRGLADETISTRRSELTRFGAWAKARRPRPDLEKVDADMLVRYVRRRSAFRARATVAGVVSMLRSMGEFLVREAVWRSNPLRWLRGPKMDPRRKIPRRLGRTELNAIWDAARVRRQEHARYQAVCVLSILYGTGLRRGELERLSVGDWDREQGILRVDGRKTGQQRHVPVGEGVWRCIEAYLPHRQNRLELSGRREERALLVNALGERIKAAQVSRMIRRLAEAAGVGHVTMHQFRHSCASDLLEAGVTLPEVQRILGHAVIDARCTLKKVCGFMSLARPRTPLWKLTLDDYLRWLSESRAAGRTESVLAKDLSHLRGLLDYAWRSGRADRNVLDGFSLQDRVRKVEPRSLTLDEAERLVRACPRQSAGERRSRLVVLLLYGCGLRTNELRELDVQDVHVERQEIFVRHGKGDRERTIPVPASVWTELLAYLLERGGKRGALLRTRFRRHRIGAKEIGEIVKAAAARAVIPGETTPRTLRHTFGTHLMDAGVDLAVIASLMGHRTPAETGVYLHVLPGKKQAAVESLLADKEEDR